MQPLQLVGYFESPAHCGQLQEGVNITLVEI